MKKSDIPSLTESEKAIADSYERLRVSQRDLTRILREYRTDLQQEANLARDSMLETKQIADTMMRMLTSEQMERAISNAGKLATALAALNDLQSHRITFAILDKTPNGD